jgi:hypothetical protein
MNVVTFMIMFANEMSFATSPFLKEPITNLYLYCLPILSGDYIGVIQWLKDWISFRMMVTPLILKVVFQIIFVLSNLAGILLLLFYGVAGLIGVVASIGNDITGAIIALIVTVILMIILVLCLLLWNVYIRVIFELILLAFNMYDSLKAIEDNTKPASKK